MEHYLLETKGIHKSFSNNKVLEDVSLRVLPGEVLALIGENGAGKSTLMKILMGIHQADQGEILMMEQRVQLFGPRRALALGIQMIHQELSPIPNMTVAENLFSGEEPVRKFLGLLKVLDRKKLFRMAADALGKVGLMIDPSTPMRDLSIAQMQLVEIARAVSRHARLIIMDEPTSALTESETRILFNIVRSLRDQGVSIIYISHKLEEIAAISDRISILRDGKMVDTLQTSLANRDDLITRMVGRELSSVYPKRTVKHGEVLAEFTDLRWKNRVRGVSFKVHRGEILGIAGLVGAGRSETMSALFGVIRKDAGEIVYKGQRVDISQPHHAVKLGMAYITEDRKATGLNLIGSVKQNITSIYLRKFTRHGLLHEWMERQAADEYIKEMRIKTDSRDKQVQLLSGGNQQKVAIARWLVGAPDLIIMDEPTRGIDVGAKHDIYELMVRLAEQGKAIIMVSSEMPEVMGMSDRILVMSDGRVAGVVERDDFDQERILAMQFQ